MSEINDQLNSLFDSMSDDEEELLSEELGIPLEKPAPAPEPKRVIREETRQYSRRVEKKPAPKIQLKETKQPVSSSNHINELAEGLGRFVASEDKKARKAYDTLQDLTEE